MDVKKIVLGSAQFGMDYGIANSAGQVRESEVEKILKLAYSVQIDTIDSAFQYGSSESIIGKLTNHHFKIITKLSPLSLNIDDINTQVNNQYQLSLNRLQRKYCDGLLVHHAADLLSPKGELLYQTLLELKATDKVKKIGVSVYSPEEVHELMDRFDIDILQFPMNLFDQRFLQNNLLKHLKKKGIELHVRSIFLQGLLLMNSVDISAYFNDIKPILSSLRIECQEKGIEVRQALIQFVASIDEIDHFIFGVDNHQQLYQIINDFINCESIYQIQSKKYVCHDLRIINPRNWNRG